MNKKKYITSSNLNPILGYVHDNSIDHNNIDAKID